MRSTLLCSLSVVRLDRPRGAARQNGAPGFPRATTILIITDPATAKKQSPAIAHHRAIERQVRGDAAIEWASHHWQVGPLCHRDPDNLRRILHPYGKDPVGRLVPHGVLDFTADIATVTRWWSRTPWNIGVRVPESMFVLDVDGPDRRPHPGKGLPALAELEDTYGPLPATLTQITGSGGLHLFFAAHPASSPRPGCRSGWNTRITAATS